MEKITTICKKKQLPNTQQPPLVSVCIPVFNGENFISEAIRSVLVQTLEDFELLIVDNCSTDRTCSIVDSFKDPRIKLKRNEKNLGSIPNFNRCIELASGEYFLLLSHDDFLMPTALETFSNSLFRHEDVGLVFSSYYIVSESSVKDDLRIISHTNEIWDTMTAVKEIIRLCNPIQSTMVRRKVIADLGGFDIKMAVCCDIDLWFRIVWSGQTSVAYICEPQSCIRIHPNQGQNLFANRLKNLKQIKDHFVSLEVIPSRSQFTFDYLEKLFNKIGNVPNRKQLQLYALDWLLQIQLRLVYESIKQRDAGSLLLEYSVFREIVRWSSGINVFGHYFFSTARFTVEKIFKKLLP